MKYLLISIILFSCNSVPEIITERIDLSAPDNATCYDNAKLLTRALQALRYNAKCVGGRARPTDSKSHAWVEFIDNGIKYIADPAALLTVREKKYINSSWHTAPGGAIEYVIAIKNIPKGYYVKAFDFEE